MKGYEFLHRIKTAKNIFAMIKIVSDQDMYDHDHWFGVSLNRDDLIKAVEEAAHDTDPPEWGLDGCEFNAVWEPEEGTLIVGDEQKPRV